MNQFEIHQIFMILLNVIISYFSIILPHMCEFHLPSPTFKKTTLTKFSGPLGMGIGSRIISSADY